MGDAVILFQKPDCTFHKFLKAQLFVKIWSKRQIFTFRQNIWLDLVLPVPHQLIFETIWTFILCLFIKHRPQGAYNLQTAKRANDEVRDISLGDLNFALNLALWVVFIFKVSLRKGRHPLQLFIELFVFIGEVSYQGVLFLFYKSKITYEALAAFHRQLHFRLYEGCLKLVNTKGHFGKVCEKLLLICAPFDELLQQAKFLADIVDLLLFFEDFIW